MTNLQRLAENVAKADARLRRAEDALRKADAAAHAAQKRADAAYDKAHKHALAAWLMDNSNNPRCITFKEWGSTTCYEAVGLLGDYFEIRRLLGFDWSDGGRPRWRTRIIRVSNGVDITSDDGAEPVLTQEQIASLVATWGTR